MGTLKEIKKALDCAISNQWSGLTIPVPGTRGRGDDPGDGTMMWFPSLRRGRDEQSRLSVNYFSSADQCANGVQDRGPG